MSESFNKVLPSIAGMIFLLIGAIITFIIFMSEHEYGLLSLLVPLFFIVIGIHLLFFFARKCKFRKICNGYQKGSALCDEDGGSWEYDKKCNQFEEHQKETEDGKTK